MRIKSRAGFTLIELLVVVVIIGILAAIAIPAFRNTTGKSFGATLKSDLRNLASAQESYFYDHHVYTPTLALLNWTASNNVSVTISAATAGGWSASATHPQAVPETCWVFYGNVAPVGPATVEGAITCQ